MNLTKLVVTMYKDNFLIKRILKSLMDEPLFYERFKWYQNFDKFNEIKVKNFQRYAYFYFLKP